MASRFGDEYRKWHDGMSPLAPMLPFGDTTKSWSDTSPYGNDLVFNPNRGSRRRRGPDDYGDYGDYGDDWGKKWRPEGGSKVPRKPKGPAPASPARKKMESV